VIHPTIGRAVTREPRHTFLLLASCAIGLVLVWAGCSDSFVPPTPSNVAGQYSLTLAQGAPLPKVVQTTASCDRTVLSGVLILRADATFRLELETIFDCSRVGQGPAQIGQLAFGNFVLDGTTITLNAIGDITYPFVGRISGRTLRVDWALPYGELTFDRL